MNEEYKMEYYEPNETKNFNQTHTVLYTFQYENAFAQIITTMGGNVAGGNVMTTDFESGITVPADHELTKKHVEFYDDEDKDCAYREVGSLIFHYPNGEKIKRDVEDCSDYLIGIQIIKYEP